ncbi:MAG: hypothetical protein AAGA47_00545 [Pseudomonadota bacterium]
MALARAIREESHVPEMLRQELAKMLKRSILDQLAELARFVFVDALETTDEAAPKCVRAALPTSQSGKTKTTFHISSRAGR